MAGVYIKDMQMPENCYDCPLETDYVACWFSDIDAADGGRLESCPLVKVSDHGRLIDADALSNEFAKKANAYYEHDREFSSSFWSGGEICTEWYAVDEILENAPTVIPADKEAEEPDD